ncbi:MAG TPA: phosphonate metabolism protein/1,5-bisphosphokinase (PRPP-forming) PhnN [Polaromonas sp.]|uniref:phosphonate metabolism protein/1,5-bisphosphokinase (PRPP-forming) PhnN n=1 Tax=Polaromonas sp. TaxID=1869339 RepID=UPI002D2C2D53|nr:phosphonate metabolism protein/1,5-bisphosphokinase (PRPP-forming) PhnN [Polaromonas sp.]HYW55318.1 phosphonate metabolism protein/1,5-bisphosphokinase (PRPP-forming) PhnN [Polaromonas sp.]
MSNGVWVFVCGPSGAGKDSVISAATEILSANPNIVFSRRMVTRPAQAGSDHDPVTEQQFRSLQESGGLSWHWEAHGFCYGVAAHYAHDVNTGRVVVVNGSRAHADLLPTSTDVRLVQITAAHEKLHNRLTQRGRDNAGAIAERLERNARFSTLQADCAIVNDGALADAAQDLADYLTGLL